MTTIKEGQLDPTTRLASKVIAATRDLSAANGDVSYTGVGFQPTSIVATYGVDGGGIIGIAITDSSRTVRSVSKENNNTAHAYTNFISPIIDGTNYQGSIVKSFDADGFTLTWTKTGSPTGTCQLYFLCFR